MEVESCSLATALYPKQTLHRCVQSIHVRILSRLAYNSYMSLITSEYYLYKYPRFTALQKHKTTCIQAVVMNPMVSPFEADRGMLHLPRCAPTKPPDPLRADDLPARQPLRAIAKKRGVLF
jgi:hypothetical protein